MSTDFVVDELDLEFECMDGMYDRVTRSTMRSCPIEAASLMLLPAVMNEKLLSQ